MPPRFLSKLAAQAAHTTAHATGHDNWANAAHKAKARGKAQHTPGRTERERARRRKQAKSLPPHHEKRRRQGLRQQRASRGTRTVRHDGLRLARRNRPSRSLHHELAPGPARRSRVVQLRSASQQRRRPR